MRPNIRGLHHDHIDGSSAVFDVIIELYRIAGKEFPFPSKDAWLAFLAHPHENLVAKFASITGAVQSIEALELLGYAYGRRRALEGFLYVEAKFAPQYHVRAGLTLRHACDAMIAGLDRASEEFGISIMPMVCIGREADPELGIEIARIALDYDGAAALDLVCDEGSHPPEKHLPAYRMTFGSKVKRDCHAGEWVSPEPATTYRERLLRNVRTAVYDLRCNGIGHAIPLADDPELVDFCIANGVRIAGCPLSNLAGGLIGDVRDLRIGELLDRGVRYTLNADDDLLFPALPEVIAACDEAYDFTAEQCRMLEENVFASAFKPGVRP